MLPLQALFPEVSLKLYQALSNLFDFIEYLIHYEAFSLYLKVTQKNVTHYKGHSL